MVKHDRATLIITWELAPGSVITSDEWPAYTHLIAAGFIHRMVNYQENYVDPGTGPHTQGVQRVWLDLNTKITKTMHGFSRHQLQVH